jgi:hypothetical protein
MTTKDLSLLSDFAEALIDNPSRLERLIELVTLAANGAGLSPEFNEVLNVLRAIWQKYDAPPTREQIVSEATALTERRGTERVVGVALAWAAANSYRRAPEARLSAGEAASKSELEEWRRREAEAIPAVPA